MQSLLREIIVVLILVAFIKFVNFDGKQKLFLRHAILRSVDHRGALYVETLRHWLHIANIVVRPSRHQVTLVKWRACKHHNISTLLFWKQQLVHVALVGHMIEVVWGRELYFSLPGLLLISLGLQRMRVVVKELSCADTLSVFWRWPSFIVSQGLGRSREIVAMIHLDVVRRLSMWWNRMHVILIRRQFVLPTHSLLSRYSSLDLLIVEHILLLRGIGYNPLGLIIEMQVIVRVSWGPLHPGHRFNSSLTFFLQLTLRTQSGSMELVQLNKRVFFRHSRVFKLAHFPS